MKTKFKMVTAEDRQTREHRIKVAIFGPPGIGKTSLIKTLNIPTLLLDFEAGDLAVKDWKGTSFKIETWEEARDIACLLRGPNPACRPSQPYSQAHYDRLCKDHTNPDDLAQFECVFIDSITVASRLCFQWCQNQMEVLRNGKIDTRAAYGLLGREMISWITQLQHIPNRDVILVGVLEQKMDDDNKPYWGLQCEGGKTSAELPGIVDEVICMMPMEGKDGVKPVFFCSALNRFGYPAKDRSGVLKMIEPANLQLLFNKIKQQPDEQDTSLDGVTFESLCKQIAEFETQEELQEFGKWLGEHNTKLRNIMSPDKMVDLREFYSGKLKLLDIKAA